MTIEVWLGGERPVFRWSVATEDSNALLAGNRNVQHWEHRAVYQGIDMHSINRSSGKLIFVHQGRGGALTQALHRDSRALVATWPSCSCSLSIVPVWQVQVLPPSDEVPTFGVTGAFVRANSKLSLLAGRDAACARRARG